MRICVIGKFPPIQGGVSMRTYWTAHGLAGRGHDVHVITNAKEVEPPFRVLMRRPDWARCAGTYGKGSVTVHWTNPADRSQYHIPMASPFVSKLAGIALRLHAKRPFDVIYSHYLEPYGVAAHIVAQSTGLPHVARMAGSDAGRLWHHAQLEPLYDHVLRSAAAVITGGLAAQRVVQRGIDPRRVARSGAFALPERLFTPDGPVLNLAAARAEALKEPGLHELVWGDFTGGRPHFGVYGKLGETKGSFALLDAMHRLVRRGVDVGLVAVAHGGFEIEQRFRDRARELGLADRILQLPFLPHWRIPEFLRGCAAVCCLEQDFPIVFHDPIIAREVLLCGACLVGSAEIIRKIPAYEQLPNRYGCVAIDDVNDVDALSTALAAIITDPKPAVDVRTRGCVFARTLQADVAFPETLERTLRAAVARRPLPAELRWSEGAAPAPCDDRFPIAALAAARLRRGAAARPVEKAGLAQARAVLAAIERQAGRGPKAAVIAAAIRTEIAVARAEGRVQRGNATAPDPLFRLRVRRWAVAGTDLMQLAPALASGARVLEFPYDVAKFRGAKSLTRLPSKLIRRSSYIVVFHRAPGAAREPLLVDSFAAAFLDRCDGARSAAEILHDLDGRGTSPRPSERVRWLETLFLHGLIELGEPAGRRAATRLSSKAAAA